jgi:hypothetical protein
MPVLNPELVVSSGSPVLMDAAGPRRSPATILGHLADRAGPRPPPAQSYANSRLTPEFAADSHPISYATRTQSSSRATA